MKVKREGAKSRSREGNEGGGVPVILLVLSEPTGQRWCLGRHNGQHSESTSQISHIGLRTISQSKK